jgi:peptide/nickel transport system permease protein
MAAPLPAVGLKERRRGPLARLVRKPVAAVALVVLGLLLVGAFFGDQIAWSSPTEINPALQFHGPTWTNIFGTDELGRDLFARTLAGGRLTLEIAFATVGIAMVIGTTWGFLAAVKQGILDDLLMRVVDIALGVPFLLLALVLVSAFGASVKSMALILGILFAPQVARVARSSALAELSGDYVLAARAVGVPRWRLLASEVLPNTLPVLLAQASLVAAFAIFTEASLSFVGLGVQPPDASWGTLVQQGYQNIYRSFWYVLFPGIFIFAAIWAFNAIGDTLQDVLDPRSQR